MSPTANMSFEGQRRPMPRITIPFIVVGLISLTGRPAITGQSGGAGAQRSGFPAFEDHLIDHIGRELGQTSLVDVDNDGDLDWIAGASDRQGSDIWWWEYQAPDRWVRHDVGKGNTDVGGAAYDVNHDGWIDILSGSRLLINPGTPRSASFAAYDVGTIYSHDTEFADINGDGRMDAVANSDKAGLYWY